MLAKFHIIHLTVGVVFVGDVCLEGLGCCLFWMCLLKSLTGSFWGIESWWSEGFGMGNQGNIWAPNAYATGQTPQELAATFAVFHPSKMTKWSSPWQNTTDTRGNGSCTRRMPGIFVTIPACFCHVYRGRFLKLCRCRQKERMTFVASAGNDLQ